MKGGAERLISDTFFFADLVVVGGGKDVLKLIEWRTMGLREKGWPASGAWQYKTLIV